ncbi:MAG: chemotaxis protein CheX [Planctomycetota bacterium]
MPPHRADIQGMPRLPEISADPELVQPFVSSVQHVFATMLQLPVEVGEPSIKGGDAAEHGVSAVIGLRGECEGSVSLGFSEESAVRIVSLFVGREPDFGSADFVDALGELANMVVGGAKSRIEGRRTTITLPRVVLGPTHAASSREDTPAIELPCGSDCGGFTIEIAIRDRTAGQREGQTAAAPAARA